MSAVDPSTGLPSSEEVRAKRWRRDGHPTRLLAIRLHAMGDTVLTLPYLKSLTRKLPAARLDMLTRIETAGVPATVGIFNDVLAIGGGRSSVRIAGATMKMLPELIARRYDVVVDLQRSRISRFVRRALAPEAWSEFDRYSPIHAGERTRATIEAIGLGSLDVRADVAPADPSKGVALLAAAGWNEAGPLVVLNPAGAFGGRNWPIASYARFAELWLESVDSATRFLILGDQRIASAARTLAERLGNRLFDLVGRTSPAEAFALVSRASLVLSEDSGLMHMAWVTGTPTLAIFGASRGVWARPLGEHSDWIQACRRPDGACIHGACTGAPPPCLDGVTAETVLRRAVALVEREIDAPARIYMGGRLYGTPVTPPRG